MKDNNEVYGKWYPCEEGSMPEDLLPHIKTFGAKLSPVVIVLSQSKKHMFRDNMRVYDIFTGKWKWIRRCRSKMWFALPRYPNPAEYLTEEVEDITTTVVEVCNEKKE